LDGPADRLRCHFPSRGVGNAAKAEFKAAWEALKARTPPEQLAAAYEAMNARDDG
jgi:hypothetical protein